MPAALSFPFDNTYARALPGCYVPCQPENAPAPELAFFNPELAAELGLAPDAAAPETLAACFSGNALPAGAEPIAQAYAGHQFGYFSPQLGDGRALLLGEVIDRDGRRRDIALKGSGRTPFSRRGDGKAVLGPMLREVLIGEALHALGIPATRALAVVRSGQPILRQRPQPGAVLTRIASSHLRVGTFEYFAARGARDKVRLLADYTLARHAPRFQGQPDACAGLLQQVVAEQAGLVAQWMGVGFIHGVMNTDNMSLAGESIDFGPCAFMESYAPDTVFSSIDQDGRYAYANQPGIAQWNLARFAETLLPLLAEDQDAALQRANAAITAFDDEYAARWLAVLRGKLGLARQDAGDAAGDRALAEDWLALLHRHQIDFTLGWHALADSLEQPAALLTRGIADPAALGAWLQRWWQRCAAEDAGAGAAHAHARQARQQRLRQHNPWIIPRNHQVEAALDAAEAGDLAPFHRLLAAVRQPTGNTAELAAYAEPAPAGFTASFRTFCGT
ncbi:MAG: hypothetical protein RIR00_884 [Pseudomonadota bacterium]|jgi:uncharacterized protein YdiU (UPF0061 family)